MSKYGVDIDIGKLASQINSKADKDLLNTLLTIDFVVESQLPTSTNNYSWYRLYRSGWVEQGGILSVRTNSYVSLPKKMLNTNYTITLSTSQSPSYYSYYSIVGNAITVERFQVQSTYTGDTGLHWRVSGMSAQS